MIKKGVIPSPNSLPINPIAVADESLKMLVNAWANYKNTVEVETTKRTAISAWRDTKVAQIDSQRQVLESYLAHAFKERASMIHGFFDVLDKGIENGDSNLVNSSIAAILSVAKESPLSQAKEIMAAMYDPNVDCIEI